MCGKELVMSVKTVKLGRDNPSNDYVLNIFTHSYQCNTYVYDNRERVHVRWTAKRGNEIDLIGQLNVA